MASRAASAAAAVAAVAAVTAKTARRAKAMEHPQAGFANEADRFGAVPDEIDTTPSDTRATPGTPSAPVWSLKDDEVDTTPKEDGSQEKGMVAEDFWRRDE